MKKIKLSLILCCLLSFLFGCTMMNSQYLDESEKVEKWLSEQKIIDDTGEIWVDEIGNEKVSLSLSNGVSGKVLFYLELYAATTNERYLEEAILGCNYIVENLPKTTEQAKSLRNGASLYGDISGSAFVLMETYKATKDKHWEVAVNHCLSLIDSLSIQKDGRYWNNSNDVLIGSSGTGLLLLYLHRELQNPKALQIAQEAAETLEQRAVKDQDSLYWYINQDTDMNLPNFSHGAAGTGYFFLSLYEATNDGHYLGIANQVAKYLESIAWKPNGSFLLPYGFPDYDWEREYDIGWAHGPAGTARFFYKFWQVTNEEKWLDIVKQCSNGIKLSGLPNTPTEHFGSSPFPIDMRFGLGGVIDFYIDLTQHDLLDSKDNYLEDLIKALDEKATTETLEKKYWQIERYGFMGRDEGAPVTFTGYFYGSAGLGMLYIKLHNVINDKKTLIKLPDNPF